MKWDREELAWAAGFIEGEGCITRQITTIRSREYGYWQLKISNTDLDTLEKLRGILGFGRIYKQTVSSGRKPTWQMSVYRQPELYAVLVAIYPFLCLRRKARATEAIMEMGSRPPWREDRRNTSEQSEIIGKKQFYQTLQALQG